LLSKSSALAAASACSKEIRNAIIEAINSGPHFITSTPES
jgi:hypothetical protein